MHSILVKVCKSFVTFFEKPEITETKFFLLLYRKPKGKKEYLTLTVEKVTFKRVPSDSPATAPTETVQTADGYNFNSSTINPFVTDEKPYAPPKKETQTGKSDTPLFGNEIIKEENVKSEKSSELPQNTKVNGFLTLSNYLKNIIPTFKTAGNKINEYDAAINNALKYLPSSGDMQILVESNPRINAILSEAGLPVKMNYDNLKTIKHTHIATTVEFARAIGEQMGMNENDIKTMEVGAALHDTGKALIPSEILNKNGKLDGDERRIINLHSVLGYEILKSAGYGINVAEIARDHHNPNSNNQMAQIVRAADVYSAMREERPYKTAKTHDEAMAVLKDMKINSEILSALDAKYGEKQKAATFAGVSHTPHIQFSAA